MDSIQIRREDPPSHHCLRGLSLFPGPLPEARPEGVAGSWARTGSGWPRRRGISRRWWYAWTIFISSPIYSFIFHSNFVSLADLMA